MNSLTIIPSLSVEAQKSKYGKWLEKEWTTKAGLVANVFAMDLGHRCGYVGIPEGHPLYKEDFYELGLEVHGSITFFERQNGFAIVGFDCGHYQDGKDESIMSAEMLRLQAFMPKSKFPHKDLEFCVNQCESLAEQIQNLVLKLGD